MKTLKFKKYQQNLSLVITEDGNFVKSYQTLVAKVEDNNTLKQLGYWSMTTQKHINYAAKEMNLTLIK
jgi:hypothetical protein